MEDLLASYYLAVRMCVDVRHTTKLQFSTRTILEKCVQDLEP